MTNPAPAPPDRRVLVIGLDGGNLEVIRGLADAGHMPFMKSVLTRGTSGELASVFPPSTPPAWSTFMTGKGPGRHGIFDFFIYENAETPLRVVNSTVLEAETLWSQLGRAGKRVGVVNVPMTYPPTPVNGVMITDLLTPSTEQIFTHPPDLHDRLKPELGEYQLTVPWRDYPRTRVTEFLRDLTACARKRAAYTAHLMRHEPWDFFMAVLSETDFLQHAVWSFLDPDDDRDASPAVDRLIASFFREIDDIVRELCGLAGDEARVFFISDHGFGPLHDLFHMNTWLMRGGWLKLKPGARLRLRAMRTLRRLAGRPVPVRANLLPMIDWSRTRAFCVSSGEQGIRLAARDREPRGIVNPGREYEQLRDEIIAALAAVTDPTTGRPLATRVWKSDEQYEGPYAARGPDILFVLRDGAVLGDSYPARALLAPAGWSRGTGTHREAGLFAAFGPGIRELGPLRGARLEDCVPTVLHAMGLPVPNDVDGRVLEEAFDPDELERHPPRFSDPRPPAGGNPRPGYSAEEEAKVRERLRGLGYVD